jgi:hypothetical protein
MNNFTLEEQKPVRAQVRAQVDDQVRAQVWDQVGAQVGAQNLIKIKLHLSLKK